MNKNKYISIARLVSINQSLRELDSSLYNWSNSATSTRLNFITNEIEKILDILDTEITKESKKENE